MNAIYIIRENEIYELIGGHVAQKLEINDGIPTVTEERIEYNEKEDILYTFAEVKSKLSSLFETKEISLENIDKYKAIIEEKDKTIASLQARIKELEELVDKLTKELEETKTPTPEENGEEETKTKNNKEKLNK